MASPIIILLDTTEPTSLIHFHPAFPLLVQRSEQFVDLPFECFGVKFETILHCLNFARFMALDNSFADLFTTRGSDAFLAAYERIQLAKFGFVANMSLLEKLKFMGQPTSFFAFKDAIETASALAHMQESEARFGAKLPAVLREALSARYARFAGTLPHPVCFESRPFPRIAEILSEILTHKAVPKSITSESEKSAYKLCMMLSKRKPAEPPQQVVKKAVVEEEVSMESKLSADTMWTLLWSLSQKSNARGRVQTLFKFVFPRYNPSSLLRFCGPAWIQ